MHSTKKSMVLGLSLVALCALSLTFFSCGQLAETTLASTENLEGFNEVNFNSFKVEWRATQSVNIEVRVTAPTTGWVAIGFRPTSQMKDANIILGYKDSAPPGNPVLVDGFGSDFTAWGLDTNLGGSDNLIHGFDEAVVTANSTRIRFIMPLSSGDTTTDRALTIGEITPICLAYGVSKSSSNQTGNKHAVNTTTQIKL